MGRPIRQRHAGQPRVPVGNQLAHERRSIFTAAQRHGDREHSHGSAGRQDEERQSAGRVGQRHFAFRIGFGQRRECRQHRHEQRPDLPSFQYPGTILGLGKVGDVRAIQWRGSEHLSRFRQAREPVWPADRRGETRAAWRGFRRKQMAKLKISLGGLCLKTMIFDGLHGQPTDFFGRPREQALVRLRQRRSGKAKHRGDSHESCGDR